MARPQKTPPQAESPQPDLAPAARDWGDTLPAFARNVSWLRWLGPLSAERRLVIAFAALAALLFLPWLGATGFWDPWEPHYGEVAREMIARGDYVHPWWESAWFFSKPALDLWLMAAGMLVANTNGPERWPGIYTEWCVRFPYAAISALGAILVFVMANRLLTRKSAVIGAFAILTSPLFVFLARQAVPDPVFVGLLEAAMACLMIVLFDEEERPGWAAAFYCFVGFATLSKGLLGFAIPGAVALLYFVVTGEWHRLRRLHLFAGSLLVLALCAPWYGTMFAFDGRDDEGMTFFERFIIHDHFKRLALGVYTSTPGGDFVYFIEQIGYDCFPWVFAFPGAAAVIAPHPSPAADAARAGHALPPALVPGRVLGVRLQRHQVPPLRLSDRSRRSSCSPRCGSSSCSIEGCARTRGAFFAGGLLYALVAHDLAMSPKHLTDMFVFNYDRPYPDRETDPRQVFTALFYAAAGGGALALAARSRGQLVASAAPSLDKRRRAEFPRPAASGCTASAHHAGSASGSAGAGVGAGRACARLRGVLRLVPLAQALAALDAARSLLGVLPPERAGRADRRVPDELARRDRSTRGTRCARSGRQGAPAATLAEFINGPGQRKWILVEQARLDNLRLALGSAHLRVVERATTSSSLTVVEKREEQQEAQAEPVQETAPGPFGAPPDALRPRHRRRTRHPREPGFYLKPRRVRDRRGRLAA